MVSDGAGGAYILYKDMPLDLVHLYVQRLDRYGYRKFSGNGVMIADSNHFQGHIYFIINDKKGGAIIAFSDEYPVDEVGHLAISVYVQRIDSTGNKRWGDNGIAVDLYQQAELIPVSLCSNEEGGCYVFWGIKHDQNHKELRVQHLDSEGNFLWDSSGVLISDQFVSYNHAVPCLAVIDEIGGSICQYYDSTTAKLQRIDSNGNFLWENGIIPFSDYWWANMKEDGSGGVILVGFYRTFYIENWYYNISVQNVDNDGNVLWGEQGIVLIDSVDGRTSKPELSIDQWGNSNIVWQDYRSGNSDVYAQRLDHDGKQKWIYEGITVGDTGLIKSINKTGLTVDNSGGIVVIWRDNRLPGWTISGQRIDSTGKNLWSSDVLISSRVKIHDFQIISDGEGGAIGCWYETPPEIGIHAQQVSINGNLGDVIITDIKENTLPIVPNKIYLFQNFPNPFNSETAIRYQLSRFSLVQITIYDLSGKEMIKLVNKKQKPETYHVLWDGKNQEGGELSSGIYFIQLKTDDAVEVIKTILIK